MAPRPSSLLFSMAAMATAGRTPAPVLTARQCVPFMMGGRNASV